MTNIDEDTGDTIENIITQYESLSDVNSKFEKLNELQEKISSKITDINSKIDEYNNNKGKITVGKNINDYIKNLKDNNKIKIPDLIIIDQSKIECKSNIDTNDTCEIIGNKKYTNSIIFRKMINFIYDFNTKLIENNNFSKFDNITTIKQIEDELTLEREMSKCDIAKNEKIQQCKKQKCEDNKGIYMNEKCYYDLEQTPQDEINKFFEPIENLSICDETISGYRQNGYRGCQNTTKNGITCQKWTEQSPHKHNRTNENYPNKGVGDHNYCRNPDNEPHGIWCYTTDKKKRWEYCSPKELKQPQPLVNCGEKKNCVGFNVTTDESVNEKYQFYRKKEDSTNVDTTFNLCKEHNNKKKDCNETEYCNYNPSNNKCFYNKCKSTTNSLIDNDNKQCITQDQCKSKENHLIDLDNIQCITKNKCNPDTHVIDSNNYCITKNKCNPDTHVIDSNNYCIKKDKCNPDTHVIDSNNYCIKKDKCNPDTHVIDSNNYCIKKNKCESKPNHLIDLESQKCITNDKCESNGKLIDSVNKTCITGKKCRDQDKHIDFDNKQCITKNECDPQGHVIDSNNSCSPSKYVDYKNYYLWKPTYPVGFGQNGNYESDERWTSESAGIEKEVYVNMCKKKCNQYGSHCKMFLYMSNYKKEKMCRFGGVLKSDADAAVLFRTLSAKRREQCRTNKWSVCEHHQYIKKDYVVNKNIIGIPDT